MLGSLVNNNPFIYKLILLHNRIKQITFMCNVIIVAKNFTIFVTQLLTFMGQVHSCKFVQRNKKLFIYFFNHNIYCILKTCCIVSDLFYTNKHLFHNLSFSVQIIQILINDGLICKYQFCSFIS